MDPSALDDDRMEQLKAFDGTNAGVKGLTDAGITSIPKIFIRPPDDLSMEANYQDQPNNNNIRVPVIDLSDIGSDEGREKVVDELRKASGEWGFLQLVNHGFPASVLDGMIDGTRKFHELKDDVKKEFYSRDWTKRVRYDSNMDLYRSQFANWRDTMTINLLLSDQQPDELPAACRGEIINYIKHVTKLGETLFELLAEALGLKMENLREMGCATARTFVCHYYPACPEPELTMGVSRHTDPDFLTILLQDQIGGLQCLHNNQWLDVQPVPGALVVNIGDFLQIVSNDKFRSDDHRVLANSKGPRISVACFFTGVALTPKIYGPLKELITEENPAIYKEFTITDYMTHFFGIPIHQSALDHFRI